MPTTRLVRRIRADFDDGSADGVIDGLDEMAASSTDPQHGSERVQAAPSMRIEESFVPEPHIGPFAFSHLSHEATLTDALHRYEELAGH